MAEKLNIPLIDKSILEGFTESMYPIFKNIESSENAAIYIYSVDLDKKQVGCRMLSTTNDLGIIRALNNQFLASVTRDCENEDFYTGE